VIAENREKPDGQKVVQMLVKYIGQEVDARTLANSSIADAFKKRLVIKAQDINIKYNLGMSGDMCSRYAEEALNRYMHGDGAHKQGSMQGRRRLGKVSGIYNLDCLQNN